MSRVFWLAGGAVLLLDVSSKQWFKGYIPTLQSTDWLGGFVRLHHHMNDGFMLGLGADQGAVVLLVVSGLVVLMTSLFVLLKGAEQRWHRLSWGLLIGGGCANWLDRVLYGGVYDFLSLHLGAWHTGIFNLADLLNLVGVSALAVMVLRGDSLLRQERRERS